MKEVRWLNDREHRMWRAFKSMHVSLERVLDQKLAADSGLSAADFAVLVPLSEAPERRLRARDLGVEMSWDRSRLSHQIRRMEQRGLIERTDCPTDARGTFIQLTELGWKTIEAAAPPHVAAVREHFVDLLTDAEIDSLTAISEKVRDRLATREVDSACDGGDSAIAG